MPAESNNEMNRPSIYLMMIAYAETIIYAINNLQKSLSLSSLGAKYVALSQETKTIS